MDEQATILRQRLEQWFANGDAKALHEVLDILETWLPIPHPIVQALGQMEAEDLRMQVIETLLMEERASFSHAMNPRAYARCVLKNRYLDACRRIARQRLQKPSLLYEAPGRLHAQRAPDAEHQLEMEQEVGTVLSAMQALSLKERAAVLLLNAPDRLPESDWTEVANRHPPPPPSRPDRPLGREQIAALLFPGEAPGKTYERVTKLIQRAQQKLRDALAQNSELSGEEDA